jgi:oxygen-independent coproporphyrinogen-3 oxidase
MAGDGLVDIRRDRIALTPPGRLLPNRLAMVFDGAFSESKPRYLQMV